MPELRAIVTPSGHCAKDEKVIRIIDESKWWARQKEGTEGLYKFVVPRNYKFLCKFMAMVNLAYKNWEPTATHKGVTVLPNFDNFRDEVTIKAGYYEVVASLSSRSVKKIAKSIAYDKMDEQAFSELYQAVWHVIFTEVLLNYTKDDIDRFEQELLRF